MTYYPVVILLAWTMIIAAPLNLAAQSRRNLQAGEIEIQEVEREVPVPLATLNYFKELASQLDRLKAGETVRIRPLSEREILYLNAGYLFCSIRRGTCPWFLDAVLEPDIINSRIGNKADCPQMHAFWKSWVKNDLQRKHDFQIQTGFVRDTMQFRKETLPRYLGCTRTVEKELSDAGGQLNTQEFFKRRYSNDSPQRKAVGDLVLFLEALQAKNVDVYGSTGITVAAPKGESGASKTRSKGKNAPTTKKKTKN